MLGFEKNDFLNAISRVSDPGTSFGYGSVPSGAESVLCDKGDFKIASCKPDEEIFHLILNKIKDYKQCHSVQIWRPAPDMYMGKIISNDHLFYHIALDLSPAKISIENYV